MGFWDSIKSLALSAKCATGWHSGNYRQMPNSPECYLEKTCPDCLEYVTKKSHRYGDWKYVKSFNCNAIKECIHCGDEKHEIVHSYKVVAKDSNCVEICECARCKDRKSGSTKHNWLELFGHELKIPTNEGKKRKCRDCGYVE